MNRKPPELPNIEDATLRACLAPLMEVMRPGGEMTSHLALADPVRRGIDRVPAGSNDNPSPVPKAPEVAGRAYSDTPKTRGESRSLFDDEHGAFRMMERFLAMTDAELLDVQVALPGGKPSGLQQRDPHNVPVSIQVVSTDGHGVLTINAARVSHAPAGWASENIAPVAPQGPNRMVVRGVVRLS